MTGALLYLQWHSLVNRIRARLKRLKQPKYLAAAVVGVLYIGLMLLGQLAGMRPTGRPAASPLPTDGALFPEMLGALLLLVLALGAWVFPGDRAALTFSEAEIAFLFPAPVTRRTLIRFKLWRSQGAILFTTLIFTLFFNRHRAGPLWTAALGWWLILSTISLHRLGASFARTMLLDRGITNWQRRLAVLGLTALAGASVLLWAWQKLPPPTSGPPRDLSSLVEYWRQLLTSGPLPWLLYPFRLIVRPHLAADATAFALALGPALLLLAAHYGWVMRADVAFEEASIEASRRLADKLAAARREGGPAAATLKKPRRPPFHLRPVGPPHMALLWKNLIGLSRLFSPRFAIVLVLMLAAFLIPTVASGRAGGLTTVIGIAAALLCVYAAFFGPQVFRQDFRADLALADVLKLYPLRGWQLVLGEVLAPALVVTAVQWLLIVVAVVSLWHAPQPEFGGGRVAALGLAAALLLPAFNFVSLLIINAATLLFPAWASPGRAGSRGFELMGQQLLLALAQMLALFLVALPPAAVFAALFFAGAALGHPLSVVPVAALAATLVLVGEILLGLRLMGRLFERLDIAKEQT